MSGWTAGNGPGVCQLFLSSFIQSRCVKGLQCPRGIRVLRRSITCSHATRQDICQCVLPLTLTVEPATSSQVTIRAVENWSLPEGGAAKTGPA